MAPRTRTRPPQPWRQASASSRDQLRTCELAASFELRPTCVRGNERLRRPGIPPSATERLKQRDGVGELRGLGLYAGERGDEISLLSGQKDRKTDLPALDLLVHQVDATCRGFLCGNRRLYCA